MALLEVKNLHTYFKTKKGIVKAVNDVSYSLEPGKTIGIVGESGSGKSVSAMSILQLLDGNGYIADGEILFENIDLTKLTQQQMYDIRGNKISVIFQEPMTSLNPVFTIKKQLSEPFMIHQKLTKKEAEKKVLEMLYAVQIPNPEAVMRQYPHQLSGGMRQRVMIAMALACRPKILIADEPTTALDVTIQAQVLELMKDLQKDFDTSILFITHDLGVVARMCDRVAVMYLGKIVESADSTEIYANPQHPYTRGLIGSVHKIGSKKEERLFSIEGTVPLAMNLPKACGFYDRCDARIEGLCNKAEPELVEVAPGHKIACFNCPHEACKEQRARVEAMLKEEEASKHE